MTFFRSRSCTRYRASYVLIACSLALNPISAHRSDYFYERTLIPQTEKQEGSGLLSGDMSAAFPQSIQRAEEVLRHARDTLARADNRSAKAKAGAPVAIGGEGGGERLTTEVREDTRRRLDRAALSPG